MRSIIGFPNPVNEKAARSVAGGVVLLSVVVLVTGWRWLVVLMALGFLARVLTGPHLSPLGQLATRAVAPRLGEPRLVPGPPKRFAQCIGLVVTGSAAVLAVGFGEQRAALGLVAVILVFALLESVLGFCAGCWVFGRLMHLGVIPPETCDACNDIRLRRPEVASPA